MTAAEITAYCFFILEIESRQNEDGSWVARISWEKDPGWSKIFESATKDEALSQARQWINIMDPGAKISVRGISAGNVLP